MLAKNDAVKNVGGVGVATWIKHSQGCDLIGKFGGAGGGAWGGGVGGC